MVGISPALSETEHVQRFGSPIAGFDLLVYTGSGLMGREVVNIRTSDIVVIVGGRSGTLGEFAIAYDEGRLIGVLTGTGGVADMIDEIVTRMNKDTGAHVIYDDDPERSRRSTRRLLPHHAFPAPEQPARRRVNRLRMKVKDLPPLLSFLGATGTVTGSRFLLETAHAACSSTSGMFQGLKHLRLRNRETFPVDPASIDAVVVTHAHLDHIGYAPALVANGFRGAIHLTTRTAQLGEIVLNDSARLQEEESDYANRHGFSKHHPALPLYTEADARRAVEQFRPAPFDVPVEVAPGVHAQFQRAGHILGSAGVLLEADGTSTRRVFVSGDVGRPDHPVLRAPVAPPAVDALLVESTYGNRRHEDPDAALERFAQAITRTAERGGMVVIPAFAVDRTEIILLALKQLVQSSRIPAIPVYADSPMALEVLARVPRRDSGR